MFLQIFFILSLVVQAFAVWPVPKSFVSGKDVLWLSPGVKVSYNGESVGQTPSPNRSLNFHTEKALGEQSFIYAAGGNGTLTSQSVVASAISRTLQIMFTQSLVPWKLVPRNQLSEIEPAANSQKTQITCLDIVQTGADTSSTFKPLAGQLDESYNLTITSEGIATITAVSPSGVIYGLETFTQLFYQHSSGISAGLYTQSAPIEIYDAPKFAHRGLNMDLS